MKELRFLGLIIIALLVLSCTKVNDRPQYSPPADHTVSMNGTMHKPGYTQPTVNCIDCHGVDLKGGSVGVSCFECHNQKW